VNNHPLLFPSFFPPSFSPVPDHSLDHSRKKPAKEDFVPGKDLTTITLLCEIYVFEVRSFDRFFIKNDESHWNLPR
jgi:hypothetical protein